MPPRVDTPDRPTKRGTKNEAKTLDLHIHTLLRALVLEAGYSSRHATLIVEYYLRCYSAAGGGARFPEFICISELENGRLEEIFNKLRDLIRTASVIPIVLETNEGWKRIYITNTLMDVDEHALTLAFSASAVKEAVQYYGKERGLDMIRCPLWSTKKGNKGDINSFTKEWDILKLTLTPYEVEDWRYNSIPLNLLVKSKPAIWKKVTTEVFGNSQLKCRVATQADQVYYEGDPNHRFNLVIGLNTWSKTIRAVNMISVNPNVDLKAILLKRKRGTVKGRRDGPADEDDEDTEGTRQYDSRKLQKTL